MYEGNTGETMNTAQVLVELLKEYRVEHIFGVPGDTTMVLYDALYAARGEITHIMARDERSAALWPMPTLAWRTNRASLRHQAVVVQPMSSLGWPKRTDLRYP